MEKYRFTFREARRIGAIGSWNSFPAVIIEADNEKEAVNKLYQEYEHIHGLKIEKVK